jgi:hypothetical protein
LLINGTKVINGYFFERSKIQILGETQLRQISMMQCPPLNTSISFKEEL